MLVVNANSAGSKEVANHYVRLRNLPASNVVALDYRGPKEAASGEVFREQILRPVLAEVDKRELSLQVDMIAYSTDFPWRIDLAKDYPADAKLPSQMSPFASLNGATFLYGFVFAKSQGLVSFESNWYSAIAPGEPRRTNLSQCKLMGAVPSRAFRSRYTWNEKGEHSEDLKQGRRYLLSTVLGVTTGRGNTVEEVVASLERAVEAEATPPGGAFYFMRNGDVRSRPRHGCFDSVVEQLHRLGAKASVKVGVCPTGAQDVVGLMTGAADLELEAAGMTIQPGAICEHLTSAGGMMFESHFQTPLSELIRAGATGASGAVKEPYAIQAKFPNPSLHLHYRRGCSLAESFYQSIAGPYQLLIVGDPLCQPWANRPRLEVEGWPGESGGGVASALPADFGMAALGVPTVKPEAPASEGHSEAEEEAATDGEAALRITPKVISLAAGGGPAVWELFIDGRLRMRLPSGKEVAFTEEQLGPGWHDLSCVAFSNDPIEAQTRLRGQIEIVPTDGAETSPVRLKVDSSTASLDGKVAVSADSPGAERIVIRHNSREVATIEGSSGGALIPAETLGRGPVRLQAIAEPSGAASAPRWTRVE